jgi:hypothetical protein
MKNIQYLIIIAFVAFNLMSCGGGLKDEKEATNEDLNHEYIETYDTLSKQTIFEKLSLWVSENFVSSKSVCDF